MYIRTKLMLWFSTMVAIILVLFSIFIFYFYSLYKRQAFYTRLQNKAIINARMMFNSDKLNEEALKYIRKEVLTRLDSEVVVIYGPKNNFLYSNTGKDNYKSIPHLLEDIRSQQRVEMELGSSYLLGITYQGSAGDYIVTVAGIDTEGAARLEILKTIMIIANIISILVVAVAGWLFARAALNPISRVINEVNSITSITLNKRLNEGNKKDEIARLAITFNSMLHRIQYSYEARKSFVANASHELRTPMANVLSLFETSYIYDADLAASKESISSATEEIKKLIKLTNGLLALANIEDSQLPIYTTTVVLDEIILQCIDDVKRSYPSQQVSFDFGEMKRDIFEVRLMGSEDLLRTAFGNVIENACKYSNHSEVNIMLEVDAFGSFVITVQDHGLGMDPDTLLHLTEPLFRGNNVKNIHGHGIGLSLTQKIISLHKGELYFKSKLNEGTTVKIILPSV